MVKRQLISRLLSLLMIVALAILIISCTTKHESSGRLIVDGIQINDSNVLICSYDQAPVAHLPLISILKALGNEPQWIDDDTAEFEINGRTYQLLLDKKTLSEKNGNNHINLLLPPPGAEYCFCEREKNEIVADDQTIWSALYLLQINVKIRINSQSNTVFIERNT